MARHGERSTKLTALLDRIGKRPDPESFEWSGRRSLLAWAVFHAFFVARLFSPLQWFKHALRERPWRRLTRQQGLDKGRRDFHARNTEQYFLAATALAASWWYFPSPGPSAAMAGSAIAWLLLVESIVWVLYYLVVRSFVERDYALFDAAEYLVLFPVLVAEQVYLSAVLTGLPPLEVLLRALGAIDADPDSAGRFLPIFGAIYLAIAIAILVSTHPGLPIRARRNNHNARERKGTELAIIGAGDVVTQRLVPALIKAKLLPANLHVFDLAPDRADAAAKFTHALERSRMADAGLVNFHACKDELELVAQVAERGFPVIIACASPAHARYLRAFRRAPQAIPFAVEKPLVVTPDDANELLTDTNLMRHGFALSYYHLEKALPLSYMLRPDPQQARFLDVESQLAADPDNRALFHRLGALVHVTICLHEPIEARPWALDPKNGGLYFETLLHPLILWMSTARDSVSAGELGPVRQEWVTGPQGELPDKELRTRLGPSYVYWTFKRGDVSATISCGKIYGPEATGQPRKYRRAVLLYERGRIEADFDALTATAYTGKERLQRVAVKAPWCTQRYGILAEMMLEFFAAGGDWTKGNSRHDGFETQRLALTFLFDATRNSRIDARPFAAAAPSAELRKLIEDATAKTAFIGAANR